MSDRSMTKWGSLSFLALALSVMFSAAVFADPVADADSVNDAFYKATAACDIPAVLNLYEDNAVVIWPGQGEFAVGKPAFQKILKTYCGGGVKQSFKVVSSDARPVGKDYIVHFGQADGHYAGSGWKARHAARKNRRTAPQVRRQVALRDRSRVRRASAASQHGKRRSQ